MRRRLLPLPPPLLLPLRSTAFLRPQRPDLGASPPPLRSPRPPREPTPRSRADQTICWRSATQIVSAVLRGVAMRPDELPARPPRSVYSAETLDPPTLEQLLRIEEEAFPPCERLGGALMQHHATLRSSGVLLAEVGGAVAGYLLHSRTAEAGLIAKFAVGAEFRRQGVGSALLKQGILELQGSSRRGGPKEIMLHVDPSRAGAVKLYEAIGFERHELLPAYYADQRDAIVMKLRVLAPAAELSQE
ncbi:hypothetical protein AB1Y20_012779 [Prymnesium parvum]|uniref:N-acetyltransferase domain-containing protein n=1 Tax=Prymnesium parvum TaxID=97485 RepID=A0AB34ILA6_PRYPA